MRKKILLYGAATRGNILLDIFQRKGYQVTAFVDQRAHEIKTYCDLPVYTISELSTRISGKSEYAVYIDLKMSLNMIPLPLNYSMPDLKI